MTRKLAGAQNLMIMATGDIAGEMVPVSGANPLPTNAAITVAAAALTDRSGTIAAGGAAQQIAAVNANRKGFLIQNQSSGDLYFSTNAVAVAGQPSIKLPAGQMYETPFGGGSTGAISVIGATTGQAFAAREW